MNLIDHTNTKVLLIGTSRFPDDATIFPIPNVEVNIKLLKQSLSNPEIIGIPESNITVSLNETRSQIEKKLRNISEETKNKKFTLLVYYTGHGILSSLDYKLYLTTISTSKHDLEIDGINIDNFKKYIAQSYAGRKIVILDCCHSGSIIGAMGSVASQITANLNGFEGTYVMTSAAEDEPSLFPNDNPEQPTYFTGEFVDILTRGLDTEDEYCSLRDIFNKIAIDFKETGKPRPQQSNFNNADQIYFSINKKFTERKNSDEIAWVAAQKKNTVWAYMEFKESFRESPFAKEAKQRIFNLEEEEAWKNTIRKETLYSYDDYLDKYPNGKFTDEARAAINTLEEVEERLWNEARAVDTAYSYKKYIQETRLKKYTEDAHLILKKFQEQNETKEQTNRGKDEEVTQQKLGFKKSVRKILKQIPKPVLIGMAWVPVVALIFYFSSRDKKKLTDCDSLDINKKISCYTDLANNGDTAAMFRLGEIFNGGYDIDSLTTAINWFTKAADVGHVRAMCDLGDIYYDQSPPNFDKAFEWWNKAAALGDSDGMNKVGFYYDSKKEYAKAASWFQKAVDKGNKTAMGNLGEYYLNGQRGLPKDTIKAIQLISEDAMSGDIRRINMIAKFYEEGENVNKDSIQAFSWYRKAALLNDPTALFMIYYYFDHGLGSIIQNNDSAFKFLYKAAEVGDAFSMYWVGSYFEHGWKPINPDSAKAFFWYSKAADKENISGIYNLGRCYYFGIYVNENPDKGIELIRKASELGSSDAKKFLENPPTK